MKEINGLEVESGKSALVSRTYWFIGVATKSDMYDWAESLFGDNVRDYGGDYEIVKTGYLPGGRTGISVVAWVDRSHEGMLP
jgi:hypothetical protein